jgi:hypothetical protein
MQQWPLGDGEHHGGQGGIGDFFGRRNRVFGLRRYSHVAFDKEQLKADAGCRARYQVDHAPAPPLPAALVDRGTRRLLCRVAVTKAKEPGERRAAS